MNCTDRRRKFVSNAILLVSLSLCVGAEGLDSPRILAQGLPGRLPGTLPGQSPPSALQPAPPSSPAAGLGIPAACCEITRIDTTKGLVSARERATGRTFQFTVHDVRERARLKVGEKVQANFDAKTVRLPGAGSRGYSMTDTTRAPPGSAGSAACYKGGCSGQVCSDRSEVITTCEWRREYACYANARCERQAGGTCGWTQTTQLQSCLQNPPQ
ncbi:MAG: hypothetical protein ABIQ84_01745 [Usitatibacter sp.]